MKNRVGSLVYRLGGRDGIHVNNETVVDINYIHVKVCMTVLLVQFELYLLIVALI